MNIGPYSFEEFIEKNKRLSTGASPWVLLPVQNQDG